MLRIAAAQMQSTNDPEENIRKSKMLMQEAAKLSAGLVVYPEYQLFLPDYSKPEEAVIAATSLHEMLPEFIHSLKIPAIINYPEIDGNRIYNTSAFVRAGALEWKYRKMHLFNAFSRREGNIFSPGNRMSQVGLLGDVAFSTYICYDLRFPELARIFALSGGSLLIYQAGWFNGDRKVEQWLSLLKATAIQDGLYVVGSAQTGTAFSGNSAIFDPNGDMIAHEELRERVIVADISRDLVESYRKDSGVLSARRDDVYSLRTVGK